MHEKFGCHSCNYLIPGCSGCSQVNWNSGIELDSTRLGVNKASFLTCDKCTGDERFVSINLSPTSNIPAPVNYAALPDNAVAKTPVKCASCQKKFDACSKCGTFGDSCTGCYQTHTLYTVPVPAPAAGEKAAQPVPATCYRCDYFMAGCLLCVNNFSCKMEKPRRLLY